MSETMATVGPALTAEEWAAARAGEWVRGSETSYRVTSGDIEVSAHLTGDIATADADDRHVLAALALHGQTFGFTREDVEMLDGLALYDDSNPHTQAQYVAIQSLMDRIAALLPPTP